MSPTAVIQRLARYPVKSLRGEALSVTTLTFQGLPEDRRYAFVQAASRSAFPWLTAREPPELLRYQPAVENDDTGDVAVTVATPRGKKWPVESEELRHGSSLRPREVQG